MESPRETIISIAAENRALRWVSIFLSVAVTVCAVALFNKRPVVWFISENGQIMRGYTKVFGWEPMEAARRALEVFFTPAVNRTDLVNAYFKEAPLSAAKDFNAQERFIGLHITKQEEQGAAVIVSGRLFRESRPSVEISLRLERTDRTALNPFGLVVSSTTIREQ